MISDSAFTMSLTLLLTAFPIALLSSHICPTVPYWMSKAEWDGLLLPMYDSWIFSIIVPTNFASFKTDIHIECDWLQICGITINRGMASMTLSVLESLNVSSLTLSCISLSCILRFQFSSALVTENSVLCLPSSSAVATTCILSFASCVSCGVSSFSLFRCLSWSKILYSLFSDHTRLFTSILV